MDFRYIRSDQELAIETAKRYVVDSIWKIANIELPNGITFPETQEIFDGRVPSGSDVNTVLVVNNLKHAWELLFDNVNYPLSLELIAEYNHLIEEGLSREAGKLRSYPVRITGTEYIPLIPSYDSVKNEISRLNTIENPVDRALEAFCSISRGQWFADGNKRTAQLVTNHLLIQEAAGIFSIPTSAKAEFIEKLLSFYKSDDREAFKGYLYHLGVGMIPTGLPYDFEGKEE